MFAYIEQDSFLHRLNPLTKLAVILFLTILLSLSLLPLVTLVISLAAICILVGKAYFAVSHICAAVLPGRKARRKGRDGDGKPGLGIPKRSYFLQTDKFL